VGGIHGVVGKPWVGGFHKEEKKVWEKGKTGVFLGTKGEKRFQRGGLFVTKKKLGKGGSTQRSSGITLWNKSFRGGKGG